MIRVELRELLEEKTGALLLIAGGFLLIQIAVRDIPDFAGFAVRESVPGLAGLIFSTGLLGFIGLAIPFIALSGLYHRLTSETPRLAVVGGALMALTPILFVSGLLTLLSSPIPRLPYLLWLSPLPYIVGAGSFGLAFFWKDGSDRFVGIPLHGVCIFTFDKAPCSDRFVGIPLLAFSGTWALVYTVGLKNGETPGWLPFLELLAVSLVMMGYLLYTSSTAHNDGAPVGG